MREIMLGEKPVRVRATALTLMFYKQAFGRDLIGDLMSMIGLEEDPSKFDSTVFLQMMWAMAKTAAYPQEFPTCERWLLELDAFDVTDQQMLNTVFEVAREGFFRGSRQQPAGGKGNRRSRHR